jgi:hypothetical protein
MRIDDINGLIVLEDYPPIDEYHGIKVISIEEIRKLQNNN